MSWVLVCAVLVSGCSTSATISMADGNDYEVEISDGDASYVYGYLVDKKTGQQAYKKFNRKSIEEIDHPGNVQMAVGGTLFASGAVPATLLLISGPSFSTGESTLLDVFLFPFVSLVWGMGLAVAGGVALGGGGLFVEGADRWLTSRDAAEGSMNLQVAPVVVPDGEGGLAPGVGLRLSR